jgi:D-alanyl-lipoteichoic acid acyltransferase DltB (MBOAT superfamily)
MLFNSASFLVFFPLVTALYFLTRQQYRWILLLLASYYFYMCWKPEYAVLILMSTAIDYVAARWMGQTQDPRLRKALLGLSLTGNLGMLFAFKYLNFFSESAQAVLQQFNVFYDVPAFDLALPVGISFYTFQSLSYTIDVYRGAKEPEKHFGIFALYVSFFPQLVAGPIERSTRLLPQFFQQHTFDYDRVVDGLKLMLWGLFKKVVIADRLAVYVDAVYGAPGEYYGLTILLATYFFAFQIYCDFSGYSDIAIGAAKVLGFDLMENFRRPYLSKGIGEFWNRWHISLSTWFRDYVYIPLGGNRVSKTRWYANLVIVFLVSGLWHGAAWTFIVWGALHGTYLIVGIVTASYREALWARVMQPATAGVRAAGPTVLVSDGLKRFLQILLTFHLVCFAWIFFRAASIQDAFLLIRNLFTTTSSSLTLPSVPGTELLLSLGVIGVLLIMHLVERRHNMRRVLAEQPVWVKTAVYCGLVLGVVFLGKWEAQQFIYFQF